MYFCFYLCDKYAYTTSYCYICGYSDGGAEIFNYIIEFRVEGTTKWTRYGSEQDQVPSTSHTLTQQLNEDTFYEFRVAAENKAGLGPYSDISERVKTLVGLSLHLSLYKQ